MNRQCFTECGFDSRGLMPSGTVCCKCGQELMKDAPDTKNVVDACMLPRRAERLEALLEQLEQCQKALQVRVSSWIFLELMHPVHMPPKEVSTCCWVNSRKAGKLYAYLPESCSMVSKMSRSQQACQMCACGPRFCHIHHNSHICTHDLQVLTFPNRQEFIISA